MKDAHGIKYIRKIGKIIEIKLKTKSNTMKMIILQI